MSNFVASIVLADGLGLLDAREYPGIVVPKLLSDKHTK